MAISLALQDSCFVDRCVLKMRLLMKLDAARVTRNELGKVEQPQSKIRLVVSRASSLQSAVARDEHCNAMLFDRPHPIRN